VVVLPQPDEPIRTAICPSWISKEMSSIIF